MVFIYSLFLPCNPTSVYLLPSTVYNGQQFHQLHDLHFNYELGRARTVYKGLYNWPNETMDQQHKQCPQS